MKTIDLSEMVALHIMSCTNEELTQLTRNALADQFQVNKSSLSRRFKKDFDLSILNYIDLEKAVRSRILIANMSKSTTVESLSADLGIAKTQQFREKFKRVFCTTPGRFMHFANNAK